MLDQEHRDSGVADGSYSLDQLDLLGGVHAGGRLVEKQQLGIGGKSPSDLDQPLLAIGQGGHRPIGQVLDADHCQRFQTPLA